ncbi:MAG: cytochrome d ubiquinol oxidase subunit II [Anaerolineae bacterium]
MSHALLQNIWFLLIGILLTGYAILDGFDLGAGVLLPLVARSDRERRLVFQAIGPFWDGNEVWLLTGGGALFAAFPHVYATVFSGFYLALMLVLFALILRAVAFEFRSRVETAGWRAFWDAVLCGGSLVPALLLGVAVGNIIRGVPLTPSMEYAGSFFTLLNPFSLLVGLAGLSMFVTHGAIYLVNKTNGALAERAKAWALRGWVALLVLTIATVITARFAAPARFEGKPAWVWVLPAAVLIVMIGGRVLIAQGKPGRAFLASALTIAGLMALFGVGCYPYLLPASNAVDIAGYQGLSIYNASASQLTLLTMLIIALIGVPIMLVYTAYIYRVFRGKVVFEEEGY